MFANFSRAFVICAVSALAAGGLTVSSAVAAERSNGETGVLVDSLLYQVRDTLIRVREGTNDGLRLTNARLSLSTVYRQEAGGKLSLWVVSAGGSVEEASTQSLVMNLRPPASGDDIPVADVGDALAQAIIEAHGAVASAELSDPPLRLDSIESTLKFIVELDGTAGAGFKILPLTVDVSGGVSSVKTHEIHLKFCSSECQKMVMRSFFSRFSFLPYLLVAFFFTSNDAHADECAFFFGKRDLSPSEMEQRYEKSLLYINDNDARGTAFLIDADGLYLTAAHVVMKRVEQRRANGQAPFVFARNPLVGEGRLKLELVDVFAGGQSSDDGQLAYQVDDLALLRLIDFELPADANPLELAIRKPRSRPERDRVRFTGYGIVRPEAPVAPRIIDNSEWDLARLEEGVYRIAASVDGGDSGGPVFLRNGNVIGLVLRQMGSGQALVHPMYRYEDRLINVFRLENDVSSFVERLVSHSSGNSIERREIAMLFQDGSVSNIEWVTAIREMKLKDSISRLDRELLSCPLIKAAEEREIGQYASIMIAEFLSRQWADLPAPEILNRAVSLEAGGDLAVAAAAYDLAIDAYRRELASILGEGGAQRAFAGLLARASSGDRSLEYESELAALAGRLGVKSPDNIVVNVSPENIDRFKTYTSDRLAVALHDFARAASRGQFVTDAMSGSGHADYFLFSEGTTDAAITAAAVGSAVGTSPQWRALNADTLFYAASGNPDIAEQLSNGVPSEQFLFDLATGQSS